ncbi:MAG TPA: hypothetical protein VI911_11750 [Patescibacteria group bacterium]|nr:hypothetical protein [Patescibacteria group bacterium]
MDENQKKELEEYKKKIIFDPLNSAEELRDWMDLFLDIRFPMGVVYPTSTHGPVEAMWRIYELMKTGESAEIPSVAMLASRDSYKCQVKGSKLLTPNGLVNIENIKIGDIVWTGWNWKKVTNWIDDGFKDGIKLTLNNGIELTSTPIHKYWILRNGTEQWCQVNELQDNDLICHQPLIEGNCVGNNQWLSFKKETIDSAHFFDLTVEDDHSYWSNGCISHNTLSAAALEVLLMIHLRIPMAHMAAIKQQSAKAIQYVSSFFRKLRPYLEHHGWKKSSDSKTYIEWITETNQTVYLNIVTCTIQGANSEHVPILCIGRNVDVMCKNSNSTTNRVRRNVSAMALYKRIIRGDNVEAYSLNHQTGLFEFKKITHAYKQQQELFEVTLLNGRSLQLGASHEVCGIDGTYRPLKDCKVGDKLLKLGKQSSKVDLLVKEKVSTEYSVPKIETSEIEQLLLGSLLGDGGCYKRKGNNAYFAEQHGQAQIQYLKWKQSILEKQYKVSFYQTKPGYGSTPLYRMYTGNSPSLNEWANFRKKIDEKVWRLNPFGLAIWFMDDGSNSMSLEFHTQSFTYEQNDLLRQVLKKNFNIDVSVQSRKNYKGGEDYWILHGGVSEKYKLYKICKDYIHPDLIYKFKNVIEKTIRVCKYCGNEFTTKETHNHAHSCYSVTCQNINKNQLHIGEILKIESIGIQDSYDFTVQDNNNFFANQYLVHNCIDEVDVVQNPTALKEAKMIPSTYQGFFPLTVYLSTRKYSGGLMEKTLKEVEKAGGEILRWNILDVCERITHETAKIDEPKVTRYISRDLPMENLSPEEWEALNDEQKNRYEKFEAYAGIAKHKMLSVMRNYLVDRPQDAHGGLFKSAVAVHNNFKTTPIDMADAQLLCNKPSASGLVYPRFIDELNTLTAEQAVLRFIGEEIPDGVLNPFEYLIKQLKDLGIQFIGGADWGYTDYTALIVLALLPNGDVWLVDSFIENKLELDDIVKYASELQENYGISKWFVDQAYPAYIKTFKRKGMKCPKFKKVVEDGIAAVQGKIVDSNNKRSFFVLKTPVNQIIINSFGEYRWSLDGSGDTVEGKPYHDTDGIADIMDAIRYPFQNLFCKSGVKISCHTVKPETSPKPVKVETHKPLQEVAKNTNQQIMQQQISSLATNSPKPTQNVNKKKILWI